jgi:hypothetical protein
MPRITVQAVNRDGEPRRWTLTERIVTPNLDGDHIIEQLVERLVWASADGGALESQSARRRSDGKRPAAWTTRTRGDTSSARPRHRARGQARGGGARG